MRYILTLSVLVSALAVVAGCAVEKVTCLDGADTALELAKQTVADSFEQQNQIEARAVFMNQDFALQHIVRLDRNNEIPYVQCQADFMSKDIKQISERTSDGTTTRWELDADKGVTAHKTLLYSVRVAEDANDYWISLDSI